MRVHSSALMVLLVALSLALAGCRTLPPSKPPAQWTAQEARGAQVFAQKCARCHSANTTHTLKGPGLQAITKVGAPPFAAPLSDQRILELLQYGRHNMPAAELNASQRNDLMSYLHSL